MVCVLFAEGTEEVEALSVVDLLRRAGVETALASTAGRVVTGSHQIKVEADLLLCEVPWDETEMLVLPGGLVGTKNFVESDAVCDAVRQCAEQGKYIAAICAAPSVVLGKLGLLKGKKATCYPGMEAGMEGATPLSRGCVMDGNIITGRALGAALDFSCALISVLRGEEKARQVADSIAHHAKQ